jgi:hypothetical protein
VNARKRRSRARSAPRRAVPRDRNAFPEEIAAFTDPANWYAAMRDAQRLEVEDEDELPSSATIVTVSFSGNACIDCGHQLVQGDEAVFTRIVVDGADTGVSGYRCIGCETEHQLDDAA